MKPANKNIKTETQTKKQSKPGKKKDIRTSPLFQLMVAINGPNVSYGLG